MLWNIVWNSPPSDLLLTMTIFTINDDDDDNDDDDNDIDDDDEGDGDNDGDVYAIGHYRITLGLFFKESPGAHPFICKSIFIHTQIKLIFMWMKIDLHMEGCAPRLALKKRPEVIRKWPMVIVMIMMIMTMARVVVKVTDSF